MVSTISATRACTFSISPVRIRCASRTASISPASSLAWREPRDQPLHGEAEAERADQRRGARAGAAADAPDQHGGDQGDADVGARKQRHGELAHGAS